MNNKPIATGIARTDGPTDGRTETGQHLAKSALEPHPVESVDNRRIITVEGKQVEWMACRKHLEYLGSGYLVLSCRKCIVRLVVVVS